MSKRKVFQPKLGHGYFVGVLGEKVQAEIVEIVGMNARIRFSGNAVRTPETVLRLEPTAWQFCLRLEAAARRACGM